MDRYEKNKPYILIGILLVSPNLLAEEWQITGSNTVRFESYDIDGNGLNSPWAHDGEHAYNELNLNFYRRISPYEYWRGQFFGLVNDSDYRHQEDGFIPERINISYEKGDTQIPFRAEVGDYYGYFSYLTQQSTLKGAMLDLQPVGDADRQHSIILLAGENERLWKDLDVGDDSILGASWLMSDKTLGTVGLNYVYSFRKSDQPRSLFKRRQSVVSAVWEKRFKTEAMSINVETEAAYFNGDHDGLSGPQSGQSQSDTGLFAEVIASLASSPITLRFRGERYGQDFRPRGAVITPDRRSLEAHATWRSDSGYTLRGRLQRYKDEAETTNPRTTSVYGVNLSGSLLGRWVPDLSGNLDLYRQEIKTSSRSTDQESLVFNGRLSKPLPYKWSGQLDLFYQDKNDKTSVNLDQTTRQISARASHTFNAFGFNGVFTPGVQYRMITGFDKRTEWNPTVGLTAENGQHKIGLDYGYHEQDFRFSSADHTIESLKASYRYQTGPHTLGLEVDLYDREERSQEDTEAYAVKAYWTVNFDYHSSSTSVQPSYGFGSSDRSADVFSLYPGLSLKEANLKLAYSNIGSAQELGRYLVFEHQQLDTLDLRQRLFIDQTTDSVRASGLIIDFDNLGSADSAAQSYAKVSKALVNQLGAPDRVYEKGDFTGNLIRDVNRGELVRIMEWYGSDSVVRFGIPRRLDGQVRMELRHGERFPDINETLWSVETVR